MPTGPKGQKRKADVIGNAVLIARIATGEADDAPPDDGKDKAATIRMGNRRFTRLTNALSKKIDNHLHMLALYFAHYNFCRIHKTLRVTPAMAAGVDNVVRDMDWIVGMIDAAAPAPNRPARYKQPKALEGSPISNTGVTIEMADARKPRG